MLQSNNLKSVYQKWVAERPGPDKDVAFVDDVYHMCETFYGEGGSVIVEAFTPDEIVEQFESTEDVHAYCGLHVEFSNNARCGDSDDEIQHCW